MTSILVSFVFAIEAVLLSLHISVTVVVVRNITISKQSFRASFFHIFACQCVVDILSFCFGSLAFHLLQFEILAPSFFERPIVGKLIYFFASFGSFFEFFAHTAIAINRFTAIARPNSHDKTWGGKKTAAVLFLVSTSSLCCASLRLFMDIVVVESRVGYALANANPTLRLPSAIQSTTIATGTCAVSFTLEIMTFFAYRRMEAMLRRRHRDDYKLLIYAMLGLTGQSLMAVYFGIALFAGISAPMLSVMAQYAVPYFVDSLSLGSSVCLLLTRRNRAYSSAFFIIFVGQSIVDCISYCFGSLTFRLLQNGLLPPQWFDTAIVGKLVFFVASFGSFLEFTAHAAIATNRFTAIVCPVQHSQVWAGILQKLIISSVFLVAPALASTRFFMDIRLAKTAEGFALVNVDRAWSISSAVTSASVALISCAISFTLEITTLVVYRRMNAQTQRQHRDDYRLLVYAMLGLVAQSLMAAYFAIVLTAGNIAPSVTATAQKAVPYIVDLLSLGGSLCLLFTSKVVRKSYLEMYSCGNVRLQDTSTVLVRTVTPQA